MKTFLQKLRHIWNRLLGIPSKPELEEIEERVIYHEMFVQMVDSPKLPPLGSDFEEVKDPDTPSKFSSEPTIVKSEPAHSSEPECDEDDDDDPDERDEDEDDAPECDEDDEDEDDDAEFDEDDEDDPGSTIHDRRWLENYHEQVALARKRLGETTPPELVDGIVSYMDTLIRNASRGDITAVWDFEKDSTVASCLNTELARKSLYSLIRNEFDMDYFADDFANQTSDWNTPKDVALYILSEVDWEREEFQTFRVDVLYAA